MARMTFDSSDRREPTTPLLPRPGLERASSALLSVAGVALLACWGLPALQALLTADPVTQPLARLPLVTELVAVAVSARPAAMAFSVAALVVTVAAGWARRQRRRLVGQVARLLKLRVTEQVVAHLVPGLRAPLRARIYIPAGYSFDDDLLDEAREVISRAWGFLFQVWLNERRDAVVVRRAWKPGVSELDAEQAPPENPLHARLEQLRPEIPQLDVHAITPIEHHPDTGAPVEFAMTYTPKFEVAVGSLSNKLSRAMNTMTASSVPDGHKLDITWAPENDTAYLRVAQTLPTSVRHPVIADYDQLGTDRFVLPYATADYNRTLWWDIDYRSPTPHGLVSGTTGSGKTTFLRALIAEGLRRGIPWLLFDPKLKELVEFELLPGVLGVVSEPRDIVNVIAMLWDEKTARFRVGRRDRSEDEDYQRLGIVYDEYPLLQFQLQRLMRADDEIKKLDPLGMVNIMVADSRAGGYRKLFGAQRPDAAVWGSGAPRMNLGLRLAMQRQDQDADQMMFGRIHVTSELDQTIPGRGVGTLPTGDPTEAQVWFTPRLDPHPRVLARQSAADRALAEALLPHTPPTPELFLPWHDWKQVLPAPSYTPETPDDSEQPSEPVVASEPDRDGTTWDAADLPMIRAADLEPGHRVLADVDGTLVPASILDIDGDGNRVDLDVRFDDGSRHTLAGIDRGDLMPEIDHP